MTRTLNRFGDRLLAALLPATEAGACVPEHGDRCGCYKKTCACVGVDVRRCYWRYKTVDCYGTCQWTTTLCNTTYEVYYSC